MKYISFKYESALDFFTQNELDCHDDIIQTAHNTLHNKTGYGSNLSGWVHLPEDYDKEEFLQIKETAQKINHNSDVLLVIGIGGSYLGARAAIEMLTHSFQNLLTKEKRLVPQIIFVGHHMSATYINELFDVLEHKDVSINIISKSGTTTEPAIAFRIFKKFIIDKYGKEEAKNRIYVTTDKVKGALKTIAEKEGYKCFVIPNDIGGRFSVLTAVGLLPIAVSGICIDDIMDGAQIAMNELSTSSLKSNQAYQYAAIRNILYNKGKSIEILANYEPQLSYFSEWWKQLFAESEGKDLKGIFPASANFTTDLHSIGQYIQDGQRNIFQTTLHIQKPKHNLQLEIDPNNYDGLNYLTNKNLHDINHCAHQGALIAHKDGLVPNLIIELPILDARTFGYLVYFFKKSCAISGHLLGVNPFNQPGVDAYKENMFALLGKQGYEDKQQLLEKRLQNKKINV